MIAQPERMPAFYLRLMEGLAGLGARTQMLHRDTDALQQPHPAGHFDFTHYGGLSRTQHLNLGPAYLERFHYVDPIGIFGDSSIARQRFVPGRINPDRAATFMQTLRQDLVLPRKSRYAQSGDHAGFPKGVIAVFLQGLSEPVLRSRHMTALEMVQAVLAHRGGRPVVIKPHPKKMDAGSAQVLDHVAANHPDVVVSHANLHDILACAAVTVSINSAVAIEGMLHRVPAVLFGRSDLHPCATTVTAPTDWPAALDAALTTDWQFDAFLLWFLRWQNVWAARPFLGRVLDRMVDQGADLAALGIIRPDGLAGD